MPPTNSTAAAARIPLGTVALLSASLALSAADQTIVGAVAPDLKQHLGISNTEIGLLVTAAYLIAAACTVPFGILTDRVHRVRLLAVCAAGWSGSITLAGFSDSYSTLLIAQLSLGAFGGATAPIVASLAGDIFPSATRGRALGFILAGEFAGAASGLLLAGQIAAFAPWRWSFWALAILGPVLIACLLTSLREPARGAQSAATDEPATGQSSGAASSLARKIRAAGIQPRARTVIHEDPTRQSIGWAIRHVLAIPTNVVIIISSALCYFYVAGIQTFAIVYLRGRFDASQELATVLLVVVGLGVIVGILVTGRVSDRLISRGHLPARITVAVVCFGIAIIGFLPGFLSTSLLLALPLLLLGAAGLGGLNPPLDAARLDVVHFGLWGRAEGIRAVIQNLIRAGAPLIFGWLSVEFAGHDEVLDAAQGGGAVGLSRAFMLLLGLFVVAAIVLVISRKAYLKDVASAAASETADS